MAEAEGEIQRASMKEIKVGRYIIIDGIACRVVDIETSAPGKHGPAKMRVTGMGIFDGQKKTLLKSSDGDAEVPVIKKRKAQVVSVGDKTVQLMDSETFEVYEITTVGFARSHQAWLRGRGDGGDGKEGAGKGTQWLNGS